ncbi:hypothetical protein [Devosia sediminis]|uniref:Uncharacterized protein n=1 Tax=Devosia sediminis TaxID=2798801 RepID=A0A934IVZ5_9HYPH|nr:hypothetical protein [Devosia sediminis]MBJ3784015.1 hypothetical protein [Devosia sediminis]
MQVNVFISPPEHNGSPTQVLVLPAGPEASIPKHLQHIDWRYFATTVAGDSVIGADKGEVEVALASQGYLVT